MEKAENTNSVEELFTRYQSVLPSSLKEVPTILKCHPPLTIFALIFAIISALPLLIFIGFAVFSFVFLLVGFLLVEGTLLAFGTCILISTLFFAIVAALGISATVWIVGFALSNWRQLIKECSEYLDTQLTKYLSEDTLKNR